ncbi:MAG: DMT family transporter [Candidatus Caldipriscus sp.]
MIFYGGRIGNLGFLFSLLVAILESFKDIYSKGILRDYSPLLLMTNMKILASLFLLPFAVLHPQISDYRTFLLVYPINLLLNFFAFYLYFSAIKVSPLSLSLPMLSFSPVLLIFTSRVMLGEELSGMGILGVFMVFAGSYILNISKIRVGLLEPIKAIFKERGSVYILIVVLIWSITANLDKVGVSSSSPIFWSFSMSLGLGVLGLLALKFRMSFNFPFLYLSLADTLSTLFQMIAISLIPVPYVISIKRLSVLFSSLWGIVFLGESANLIGILFMILGGLIIYYHL